MVTLDEIRPSISVPFAAFHRAALIALSFYGLITCGDRVCCRLGRLMTQVTFSCHGFGDVRVHVPEASQVFERVGSLKGQN